MRYFRKYVFALTFAALCAASGHAATIFNFADFSSCTGLQVNGNAACTGGVLRVTPAIGGQFDNAFGPIGAAATGVPALSDFALALAALLVAGAGLVALRKRRVFG